MIRTFTEINNALFMAGFIYSHGHPFVTNSGKGFVRNYERQGKYIKVISPLEDDDRVKAEDVRVIQVSHAILGRKSITWAANRFVHF